MRFAPAWLAVWLVVASSAHAQSVPAYSLLREKEDWSFLRDTSLRPNGWNDIWDPLKHVRLGPEDWYLTIGGEVREVFEQVGNNNCIAFRVGRQELNYGSGRLISVREGPNVRQSFAVKIMSAIGPWNVDAFAARPDLDKPGFFNNAPDHRTSFWGFYASRPGTKRFRSTSTTWVWIERWRHTTGGRVKNCGIVWRRDSSVPSRPKNEDGISTMKVSGNSEHLGQATSARGRSHQTPGTVCQICRSNHG
jgi:hypothetical protein